MHRMPSNLAEPVPAAHRPAPRDERIGERDLAEWDTRAGRRVLALVTAAAAWLEPRLRLLWRWSFANLALVLTVLVGGALAYALSAAAGEVYESVTERDGLSALDQPVLDQAVAMRTPTLSRVVTDFTDIGGVVGMPVLAAVTTVGLALAWRRWTPIVLMLIAAAGSLAITVAGKEVVGRARPPHSLAVPPYESSASFPSGHTLNATVVLGITAYLLILRWEHRWARVLTVTVAVIFVVAMGLSRVFLGHHWLTDVVAGWLVGLGWVAIVVTAHRVKATLDR